MKPLIKNIAIYTFGSFITKLVNFILLPVYTYYLTVSEFGIVNSMQVLGSFLIIFFTLSLESSYMRLYYDYKTEEEKKVLFSSLSIFIYINGLTMVLLLFVLNKYIGTVYKSIGFFPFYALIIISTFFSTFSTLPLVHLRINEKATKYLFLSLLQLFMNIAFTLVFLIFLSRGARGFLEASLISNLVIAFIYFLFTYSRIDFRIDFSILKKSILFALPIIPTLLIAWIIDFSDRLFIERYFNLESVGIYSLAYRFGLLVTFISSSIATAYNPYFFKLANSEDQVSAQISLYKSNNIIILLSLFLTFLISFFSQELIMLFFNKTYLEASKIIPLIAFSYFLSCVAGLYSLMIYQSKKMVRNLLNALIVCIVNILLNFILIPVLDYNGAAISTFITFLVMFLIAYFYVKYKCYFIDIDGVLLLTYLFVFISLIVPFYFIKLNIIWSITIKGIICSILFSHLIKKYYKQIILIFKK